MKEDHTLLSNARVQKKKITVDPNFWVNGCAQKKEQMKEDHIFLSNGRVQKKKKSVWILIFG